MPLTWRVGRREPEPQAQLDRYWDAVVAGHDDEGAGLDPALTVTVQALQRRAEGTPAPSPAFLMQLRERIAHEAERLVGSPSSVPSRFEMDATPGPGGPTPSYSDDTAQLGAAVSRGWRRWAREGGAMAAAALVVVLVAGLLVVVLGERSGDPGANRAGTVSVSLPVSRTSSGFTISLDKAQLSTDFLTLTFHLASSQPDATPDLRALGGFSGFTPSLSMALDGLVWDQAFQSQTTTIPGTPVAGPTPATGGVLPDYPVGGYDVTLPFRLTGDADRPVTVEIRSIWFAGVARGSSRKIVDGQWSFSIVPAEVAEQVPATPTASGPIPIAPAIETLSKAGLVFPIDKTFTVSGQQITLEKLAADQDITYLVYRTDDGQPAAGHLELAVGGLPRPPLQLDSSVPAEHPTPTEGPGTFWIAYPGLPHDTSEVRLSILPEYPDPVGVRTPSPDLDTGITMRHEQFTMPVDLSPLDALPATPQPVTGSATANGVKYDAVRISRGIAVSTIELSATLLDENALVPDPSFNFPYNTRPIATASVDGKDLPVVGLEVQGQGEGQPSTVQFHVVGLPAQGTLHLRIENAFFRIGTGAEAAYAKGPWEIDIDLGSGAAH